MFSKALNDYVVEKFETRREFLGIRMPKILKVVENTEREGRKDEALLLKFLYGTMPLRDAGEYEPELFLSFVRHAMMVRETMEWCRNIPEELFLHHILYYRINSENIENCRDFFYEQLKDRVQGKTMKEAALEVNYWCAEQASYAASDDRTISPMTVYRTGNGRCGEESTFTVTALRSVGIPARQVYTPRWAHCDDNHAWVEVWTDGKWHFLGACEPEEILDKGWFTNAATRALLVHSRTFSDFGLEDSESCIGKEEGTFYYNETSRYAKTKYCTIQVNDGQGEPVCGAKVSIEVLNMAEYHPIAALVTDERGETGLTLGLGDVHLHVQHGTTYAEMWLSVAEKDHAEIILEPVHEKDWIFTLVKAPEDGPVRRILLTKDQKETQRKRLREADILRNQRQDGYYRTEDAEKFLEEADILRHAGGNFKELYEFLTKDGNSYRKKLLHTLSRKDAKDAKAWILEDHLNNCEKRAECPEELFVPYVLCPRIYLEELTPWRSWIWAYLTEKQKEEFQAEPEKIWDWICQSISYDPSEDYSEIYGTPAGCLRLGRGTPVSQKILFVAVCRTLGIPARLDPVRSEAEYWRDGAFVSAAGTKNEAETAFVRLSVENGEKWKYYQTWTIGKLCGGQFQTLDHTGLSFENNRCRLCLEPGIYRLITTSRMPNGNQHTMELVCSLAAGEEKEIFLPLREGSVKDMLISVKLDDISLDVQGETTISQLLKDEIGIVAFLEEGKEPTEHVLNEILEAKEELENLGVPIVAAVGGPESLQNQTLQRVLKEIPAIQTGFADFDSQVEPLARRVYVDPDKLPLLLVIRPKMTAVYGCSGYHVGSVRLMAACIRQVEKMV